MVYSVNVTRAFDWDNDFFHLAVCSTIKKAVKIRRQLIREFTEGSIFDGLAFDKKGNLLTQLDNPMYTIEIGEPIGSKVDDFDTWCIMDTATNDKWVEVTIKPMIMDMIVC